MVRFVAIVSAVTSLGSLLLASEPTIDSIDYSSPKSYLEIPTTLGKVEGITKQAAQLKGVNDRATIRRTLEWMESHLKYDPQKAYAWRNYDDAVRESCYASCADQAIVCGVLLKAAGIPTVWVKTMDTAWIWEFKNSREPDTWSGHVFLEVYLDGQWRLLDPGAKLVYENYWPKNRILPGNRFAYHKGDDPKEMVLSLQWEEWKQQTRKYFTKLDPSLLPIDTASARSLIPQAYLIGNSPYYQTLTEMAKSKGWITKLSFNTDYKKNLPLAKGHILLIETHKGVPIVPLDVLHSVFPKASKGLSTAGGVTVVDETTIVFVDFSNLLKPVDEPDVPAKTE
jgi:hypothetical protein